MSEASPTRETSMAGTHPHTLHDLLARGKLVRRIEKSRIQIEEGRDWCCQKTAMNGRNMARSSSKILEKSGAILNARRKIVWQRREWSGPALIIFEYCTRDLTTMSHLHGGLISSTCTLKFSEMINQLLHARMIKMLE